MELKKSKWRNKLLLQDIFAAAAIAAVCVFYLAAAYQSPYVEDEGFYLTIPYRLILGEKLLINEWHISQFSSFFLYLPVKLYISLRGDTTGIIFAFRLLFIPFYIAVSVFLYTALRKYGIISVAATFFFCFQTPMGIRCGNYNTLGISFILISVLILLHIYSQPASRITSILLIAAGLFYAFAVINNPLLAAAYVILCAVAAINGLCSIVQGRLKKRRTKIVRHKPTRFTQAKDNFFSIVHIFDRLMEIRAFLFFTGGVSIAAVAAVVYFYFTGAKLSDIAEYLPNLFGDVQHSYFSDGATTFFGILSIIKAFLEFFPWQSIVLAVVIVLSIIDYKVRFRTLRLLLACVVFFIFTAKTVYFCITSYSNETIILYSLPLFLLGTMCIPLVPMDERKKKLLAFFYIPGLITGLCYSYSSNLQLADFCFGLAIANIACIFFVAGSFREAAKHYKEKNSLSLKRCFVALFGTVLVAVFCAQISTHGVILSKGAGIFSSDTVKIERGPLAGLYYSAEQADAVNMIMDGIDEARAVAGENSIPLFYENIPWEYLYTCSKFGTYTSWSGAFNVDRLLDYYKANPDSIPDYVYITGCTYPDYKISPAISKNGVAAFSEIFTCTQTKSENGYILYVYKDEPLRHK